MRYNPGHTPDGSGWRPWLSDELRRISNAIGAAEMLQLSPIDVAPEKPTKGMLVYALAVNWNPGAGEGLYLYKTTWVKVA